MDQLATPAGVNPLQDLLEPGVVHQASGMISARDHISCEEALRALRRYAMITDQPLVALSCAIVARAVDPKLDGLTYK